MKKIILSVFVTLFWVSIFSAHDLFLKLETFFLKPNSDVAISLLNGTFEKSENVITRDRMLDVSIVGPEDQRIHPDTAQWRNAGMRTILDFKSGKPGTYVVGVSTAGRYIDLSAKDFNDYLVHDGVVDVLEMRKKQGELEKDARELYSKHVKAIIQVGDKRSKGFAAKLGYPVEIVPVQNPYKLKKGDSLEVLFLKYGKTVANQLIYAGYEGFHSHDDKGDHQGAIQTRTDKNGIAKIQLKESGRWYIRLINMVKSDEKGTDYESNWATLTFEIE